MTFQNWKMTLLLFLFAYDDNYIYDVIMIKCNFWLAYYHTHYVRASHTDENITSIIKSAAFAAHGTALPKSTMNIYHSYRVAGHPQNCNSDKRFVDSGYIIIAMPTAWRRIVFSYNVTWHFGTWDRCFLIGTKHGLYQCGFFEDLMLSGVFLYRLCFQNSLMGLPTWYYM